jgi:hypothetical protein
VKFCPKADHLNLLDRTYPELTETVWLHHEWILHFILDTANQLNFIDDPIHRIDSLFREVTDLLNSFSDPIAVSKASEASIGRDSSLSGR